MKSIPARRFVREGEAVEEGSDPIHCGMPHPDRAGWTCRGFVGLPEPGAVLLTVFPRGEFVGTAQRGLWALRCEKCGRSYVFRSPDALAATAELAKLVA